jgi:3D (Asp-Asp-Asp) domain-containing protein
MRKTAIILLLALATLINPTDSLTAQSEVNKEKGGMKSSATGESETTEVVEQLDKLLADIEENLDDLDTKANKLEKSVDTKYIQFLREQERKKEIPMPSRSKPSGNVVSEFYVSATAYTAYCNGCSGITATGINLRANPSSRVIAVDPNVIPLGSKVWVEGYGYAIAGDTGGAIKGNKIDVFTPTKSEAFKWGRRTVRIKVFR